MILVDTSVWIRMLAGRAPFASEMHDLISSERVVGHNLVYGELLIGDSGGRKDLLETYANFDNAFTVAHADVVFLTRTRKLHGRGLSWIDVHLLASAMSGRHKLYTADLELAEAAGELGVAYSPKISK